MMRSPFGHVELLPGGSWRAEVHAGKDPLTGRVHGHLRSAGGAWQLTWTNAGHPPPLLGRSGGKPEQLGEHGPMLSTGLPDNHQRLLVPGDTLLLYTDRLVEHRTQGMDPAISRVAALLFAAPASQPLHDLLGQLIGAAASGASRPGRAGRLSAGRRSRGTGWW